MSKQIDVMELTAKERNVVILTLKKKVEEYKGEGSYNIHVNHINVKGNDDYSVEYTLMHDDETYTNELGKELYLANLERFVD